MEVIVAIEDGDQSEHELDVLTDQDISIESDSPRSGNSSVSLLSILKVPDMSELSRKQKIIKNPSSGKRRSCSSCQSNPKGIKPQQRLKEYLTELFILSSGKLFAMGVAKNGH